MWEFLQSWENWRFESEKEKYKNHQLIPLIVPPVWTYKFKSRENNLDGKSSTNVTVV